MAARGSGWTPASAEALIAALVEREQQLAAAQRLARIGSWSLDVASGEVTWSDEHFQLFDLEPQSVRPTLDWTLEQLHPDDRDVVQGAVEESVASGRPFVVQYRAAAGDSAFTWLEARGAVDTDGSGRPIRVYGTSQDITAAKTAERELHERGALLTLFSEVVSACNSTDEPHVALAAAMAAVCTHAGWSIGHAFVPAGEGRWASSPIWHLADDERFAEFKRATESMTSVSPGECLPCLVVETRQPVWIFDAQQDRRFRRRPEARSAELCGAFAFPVLTGEEVVAVLEFFSELPGEPGQPLLHVVEQIGVALGRVFERRESRLLAEAAAAAQLFLSDVRLALVKPDVDEAMRGCTDAVVRHLGAAFARIWVTSQAADVLELLASSGLYTHIDGPHGRVRIGDLKIGRIAANRRPHLTNDVPNDPEIGDQQWARDEGMVSFAGYPLIVDDELVGVMAMFARHPLGDHVIDAMGVVSGEVAGAIVRKRAIALLEESERRFRTIFEHSHDIITVVDADANILYSSGSAERLLGIERQARRGRPVIELVHPDDRPEVLAVLLRVIRAGGGQGAPLRCRVVRPDGALLHFESVAVNLLDDSAVDGVVIHSRDVSDRVALEESFAQQHGFVSAVLQNLADPVIACDAERTVTLINDAARALLPPDFEVGDVRREALAEHFGLYQRDGRSLLAEKDIPLLRALRGEEVIGAEVVMRSPGHRPHNLIVNARAVRATDGSLLGAVSVAHDITDQRLAEDALTFHLRHDPLTGLPNHETFRARLQAALDSSTSGEQRTTVLAVDIDGLGEFNDAFGHAAGDRLVAGVAVGLSQSVRPVGSDHRPTTFLVSRFAGDEFLVMCHGVGEGRELGLITRRVQEVVAGVGAAAAEGRDVTASVGVAVAPPGVADADAVILDAQAALRRAKGRGPCQVEVFAQEMRNAAIARHEGQLALRRAVDNSELRVYYQAKVDLGTGRVIGAEALVRWGDPHRGLVPPAEFIPLAEDTGLIVPIGAWVLEEACTQAAEWVSQNPGRPFVVCVNVSARQFDSGLVALVEQALRSSGLPPSALCLEVTESVVMTDVQPARATLQHLKDLGVRISIDDFGTGYSSLAYLSRFPIDELKVDKSFVDRLGREPEATAIVAAIVSMAHALSLEVIAEGIEDGDQVERLRVLGCEYGQGYFFARPVPADEYTAMLEASRSSTVGPEATGPSERTVLVVDDADDVRLLSHMSLSAAGYAVTEAGSGEEALEIARELHPSCILLDIDLPGIDGFEVCRQLRDDPLLRECTIVVLSGHAGAAEKVKAFSAGADDYMVKPFSPRDLVGRVQAAIRRRSDQAHL